MSRAIADEGEVDTVSLLLQDKGWVSVQIKAFTAWVNQTIAHRSSLGTITDLSKDFRDGVILVNFFELLAGKKMRDRWTQKPKHRIEQIQNIHLALLFMEKEMQVKNPGIG
jgi:cortexillin 1/2